MILSGWKEIAKYPGRGVRTVQRWELIGLPVRRVPQGRGSVFAIPEELDVWLETCETHATSIFPNHRCPPTRVDDATQTLLHEHGSLLQKLAEGLNRHALLRKQLAETRNGHVAFRKNLHQRWNGGRHKR